VLRLRLRSVTNYGLIFRLAETAARRKSSQPLGGYRPAPAT
jgi:hypothetical protein